MKLIFTILIFSPLVSFSQLEIEQQLIDQNTNPVIDKKMVLTPPKGSIDDKILAPVKQGRIDDKILKKTPQSNFKKPIAIDLNNLRELDLDQTVIPELHFKDLKDKQE